MSEKLVRIYLAVIGDGYLYGASRNPAAAHATGNQYWIGLRLENESFEIIKTYVPPAVADRLENVGTSDQEYSDGYEAMQEALKYGDGVTVDTYEVEEEEEEPDEDEDIEDEDEDD